MAAAVRTRSMRTMDTLREPIIEDGQCGVSGTYFSVLANATAMFRCLFLMSNILPAILARQPCTMAGQLILVL